MVLCIQRSWPLWNDDKCFSCIWSNHSNQRFWPIVLWECINDIEHVLVSVILLHILILYHKVRIPEVIYTEYNYPLFRKCFDYRFLKLFSCDQDSFYDRYSTSLSALLASGALMKVLHNLHKAFNFHLLLVVFVLSTFVDKVLFLLWKKYIYPYFFRLGLQWNI